MRSTPDQPDHGAPDVAADGSPLGAIERVAVRLQQDHAELLRLTCEALRWGGTAAVAGCTVEDYLVWEAGLPRPLAVRLVSVARRLPAVPEIAGLFAAGVLGFDQLAGFVRATSAHKGELLARLDVEAASLAEQLAHEGRLHSFDVQVEFLAEELRAPGWRSRQERRLASGERVVAQQDFDGGGFIGKTLGPVGFAAEMAALDTEMDPAEVVEFGVQRARAKASTRIAEAFLAGDCGDGRPARPTVVWNVDVADATVDRFAQTLRVVGTNRTMVPISQRLLATLADQADHVIALRDGARPLDELAVDADDVPAKVRRAVVRRDRGCRFPDCGRARIQVHHILPRSHGGTHAIENLVGLCSFHHLRYVHRLGWSIHLDPKTGLVTWTNTRTGTEIGTMPIGARPPPRRDPSDLPDWAAPSFAPPPDHTEPPDRDLVPASWTSRPHDLHA